MSFQSWCACHLWEVKRRLGQLEDAIQRRRLVVEWDAEQARLWALVARTSPYGTGIARDIAEWRTEP